MRGVPRAGGRAGGGAAQHGPDQGPAVPGRLEQQAVPGVVGVPGLDPGGALVRPIRWFVSSHQYA